MKEKKIKTQQKEFLFVVLLSVFLLLPFITEAASFYLLPSSQKVYQTESFISELRLNTEGEDINAVQVKIGFPLDLLEAIDISTGNSVLTLWPEEPSFSNQTGEISFIGGVPKGFNGDGVMGTVIFRGKKIGNATVNFKEDSQVLLNDGKGTKARLSLLEGSYEIINKPENIVQVSSSSHPDPNKWFRSSTLHLHWGPVEGVEYSFVLSRDPLVEPDDVPEKPKGTLAWVGDIEYPGLEDGVYYFAIKQKPEGENWTEKTTFRVMVDATLPEPFELQIGKEASVFEGKYFVSFSTKDNPSGIDHYELLEEQQKGLFKPSQPGTWKVVKSPYVLKDQSLKSVIRVKAIDRAGNERIAEFIPPYKPFPYWIVVPVVLLIIIVRWLIIKMIRKILLTKKR